MEPGPSEALSPDHLIRLTEVFHSKNWPVENPGPGDDLDLFDRFSTSLSLLSSDEKDLILTLTEDFLRCTYFDYPRLMLTALEKISPSLINNARRVFLLPLLSSEDLKKGIPKSGNAVLYPTYRTVIPYHHPLRTKPVEAFEKMSVFHSRHSNRRDSLLLFLDDFVGTGETASRALKEYQQSCRVRSDKAVVVTMVAQERGVKAINALGYDVFAAHVRGRGISDSIRISNIRKALSIMDRIESRLQIAADYLRGYHKSEALVKMIRTPNNTFPVYWCEETRNGTIWPAPFRR